MNDYMKNYNTIVINIYFLYPEIIGREIKSLTH